MKRQGSTPAYGVDDQSRRFLIFSGISFFGHVFLFVLVLLAHLPGNYHLRVVEPAAINVDLAGFNPETPLPSAKGKPGPPKAVKETHKPLEKPVDKPIEKAEKIPESSKPKLLPVKEALKKKVNLETVKVEQPEKEALVENPQKVKATKKPLVKKKIDPAKVLESAMRRMEQQAGAGQSEPKSIADRIASLKKEVEGESQPTGTPFGTGPAGSIGSGGTSRDFTQLEAFQAEVSVLMKNNWVFSEKLAGETKGLESRLVIKIMPDGTITDVWFEKRSGNSYLDNSAYKTVMKSNPLPPLPAGMPYYHLVLGFTPSGLN